MSFIKVYGIQGIGGKEGKILITNSFEQISWHYLLFLRDITSVFGQCSAAVGVITGGGGEATTKQDGEDRKESERRRLEPAGGKQHFLCLCISPSTQRKTKTSCELLRQTPFAWRRGRTMRRKSMFRYRVGQRRRRTGARTQVSMSVYTHGGGVQLDAQRKKISAVATPTGPEHHMNSAEQIETPDLLFRYSRKRMWGISL